MMLNIIYLSHGVGIDIVHLCGMIGYDRYDMYDSTKTDMRMLKITYSNSLRRLSRLLIGTTVLMKCLLI